MSLHLSSFISILGLPRAPGSGHGSPQTPPVRRASRRCDLFDLQLIGALSLLLFLLCWNKTIQQELLSADRAARESSLGNALQTRPIRLRIRSPNQPGSRLGGWSRLQRLGTSAICSGSEQSDGGARGAARALLNVPLSLRASPSGETKTSALLQSVATGFYYPNSRLPFGEFEARLLVFTGVALPLAGPPVLESRN